jgi:hypothetical protein
MKAPGVILAFASILLFAILDMKIALHERADTFEKIRGG